MALPPCTQPTAKILMLLCTTLGLIVLPATGQQRYSDTVPDTLDLVDYANFAINGLTQTLDPAFDYEIFFRVDLSKNPAYLQHDTTGLPTNNPKFAESLAMMRVVTGSDEYADIDKKMMDMMLRNIASDGLFYVPYSERRTWHEGVGHDYKKKFNRDFANVYGNSRLLLAMIAWYEKDKDPAWKPRMKQLADALGEIAIKRHDYAYYPDSEIGEAFSYAKGLGWLRTEEPVAERMGAEGSMFMYHCGPIRALARYYALTGDKTALDIAAKLVRFVMKPQFWGVEGEKPWGATGAERGQWTGHPHAHIATLRALFEYAYITDDDAIKNFVRNSYEYARSHYGLPRIGMFGEGCTNADMPALAIMLNDAGLGDYWEDVDQYARNHMVESMFTRPDLIQKVVAGSPKSQPNPPQDSADDAIHRAIGIVGSPGISFVTGGGPGIACMAPYSIGCCTGNLTQAIYYVWESIVRFRNGNAQVNLLLNRASPWLDVDSYLPYEGKVVIRNKISKRIAVRIPSWVDRSRLTFRVNSEPASPAWVGNFAALEGLKPNDAITLEFPVKESEETYTHNGRAYTLHFKGNTVVDVSPRQDEGYYPIYQRDQYKQSKAPMKQVSRYVAPSLIKWWSGVQSE